MRIRGRTRRSPSPRASASRSALPAEVDGQALIARADAALYAPKIKDATGVRLSIETTSRVDFVRAPAWYPYFGDPVESSRVSGVGRRVPDSGHDYSRDPHSLETIPPLLMAAIR